MKNAFVNAALVAGTICMNTNLHAQESTQAEQVATENAKRSYVPTVLDGTWSISLDKTGSLHVLDKNNKAVRVVEGVGPAIQKSNGSVFNSPATYPIRLTIDKAGDLHIDDISVYATSSKLSPRALAQQYTSYGDPDMFDAMNSETVQMVHVYTKQK